MNNNATEKVFDTLLKTASEAGWDCDIDDDRGSLLFTKEMPMGDDYSFYVLFDTNDAMALMDQIMESIDEETMVVNDSDFAAELEDRGLSVEDGSAYKYANIIISSFHSLESNFAEAFEDLEIQLQDEILNDDNRGSFLEDVLIDTEAKFIPDDSASEKTREEELSI